MLSLLVSSALAQNLLVSGNCPGPMDARIAGVTPNGSFAAVTGAPGGSTRVPAGRPCAGTVLDVGNATPRVVTQASAQGTARLTPNVPQALCGQSVQILDLTTCTTSPAVSIGQSCSYPNNVLPAQGPSLPVMADPAYMGVRSYGVLENGVRNDWAYVDVGGVRYEDTAGLQFVFYDANVNELCRITYDFSAAASDPNLAAYDVNGGPIVAENGQTLDLSNGMSTCGYVNPNVWGTADLRDYVEALNPWSVATSPLSATLEASLTSVIPPADWAADWDPYVFSESTGYGGYLYETNFAFSYDHTCDEAQLDAAGSLTVVPPTSPASGLVIGEAYYIYSL